MRRREFIVVSGQLLLSVVLSGCKRGYQRPATVHDLGPVEELLYSEQFIRERGLLLLRDGGGWAVISARCSHDGCNLSFQDQVMTCICCGSMFSHAGAVVQGPARIALPYYQLSLDEDHLMADTGVEVSPQTRFTTPEIEQALVRVREILKTQSARPGMELPDAVLGKGSGAPGPMFKERKDEVVPTLIKDEPTPTPSSPQVESSPSLLEKLKRDLLQSKAK